MTSDANDSHISDSASDLSDGQFLKENLITMGKMHQLRTKMDLQKGRRKSRSAKRDISFGEQCANESIQSSKNHPKTTSKCDKKKNLNPEIGAAAMDFLSVHDDDDDGPLFVPFKSHSLASDIELNKWSSLFNSGRNAVSIKSNSGGRSYGEKVRDHFPSASKWSIYRSQAPEQHPEDGFDRFSMPHDPHARTFSANEFQRVRTFGNIRRSRSFKSNGNEPTGDECSLQMGRHSKKNRDTNFDHFNSSAMMMKSRKSSSYGRQAMHRTKFNEIEYPRSHVESTEALEISNAALDGDKHRKWSSSLPNPNPTRTERK